MSKGGKNPSPDKTLDSRGDSRKIRRLKAYPKLHLFPFKIEEKPQGMSKLAETYWDAVVPSLAHLGVICEIDKPLVMVMCETWAAWSKSMKELNNKRLGFLEITPDGQLAPSPLMGTTAELEKRLIGILKEFGMAPGYRTKIENIPGISVHAIGKDKPAAEIEQLSEWDEFLK